MAADISALVRATIAMKQHMDRRVGWPLAAALAIRAKGITHPPDVNRLKKSVIAALQKEKKGGSMLTPEQAARDFNTYLARQHARGGSNHINFAQLPAMIDAFRVTYYPHLSSHQVPEVSAIEAAVRSSWGVKGARKRATRKQREAAAKRERDQRDRQYELPL